VSAEPGLYFLGLPWQSRRGSSFIWGVWHDARYLADQITIQRNYTAYHNASQREESKLGCAGREADNFQA
jgi:putative flavoprotein involved in K+ transport